MIRAILICGLVAVMPGCGWIIRLSGGVPGSGVIVSESRNIEPFHRVSFSGAGVLTVDVGSGPSLEMECDDNLLELIRSEVVDGTLQIYSDEHISPTQGLKVHLTTDQFDRLSVAGSCKAKISSVQSSKLEVSISGSGNVTCDGTAESLNVEIAGSGNVECAGLVAKTVQVRIAGSGDVAVHALDELNVRIAGSGRVQYIGSPRISQKIAGSGNVRALAAPEEEQSAEAELDN